MKANNIIPKRNQTYYTVSMDGKVAKRINGLEKVDLFNIMYGLCWDSSELSQDDIDEAVIILYDVVQDNLQ